jgi:hypothetical protein
MKGQGVQSALYESYELNKELHFTDKREGVRGSFVKSASSSRLAARPNTLQPDLADARLLEAEAAGDDADHRAVAGERAAGGGTSAGGVRYAALTVERPMLAAMSSRKSDKSFYE